jgi:hypothetical protein
MAALLFIILFLGPCAPTDEEALFCEDCPPLELAEGAGGAAGSSTTWGGDGGAGPGQGGADATGGDGGAGGSGPPPCECDDGNPCNGLETCAGDGSCVVTSEPEPLDDRNACTSDYCENGEPRHAEDEIDDGDPCTNDYCDPNLGIIHSPLAVCED